MQNRDTSNGRNRDGGINRFEDLIAWQEARVLARELYSASQEGPLKYDHGLRDQLRRASVSVMSNIAEGFERIGSGEKAQFMNIARASSAEVKSLLYVCLDNQYLDMHQVSESQTRCTRISRLTSGLIRSAARKKTKEKQESESQSESEPKQKQELETRLGHDLESGRPQQSPIPNTDSDSSSASDSDSYSDFDSAPDSDSEH